MSQNVSQDVSQNVSQDVIHVTVDSNEMAGRRAAAIQAAVEKDDRFVFDGFISQLADLNFHLNGRTFWVELKECGDYISSVVSGHLFDQILRIRESGDPGMVLVIGSDAQIEDSVVRSVSSRGRRGNRSRGDVRTYMNLIRDFEANAYALNVPVIRMDRSPCSRLLSIVHKLLTGADLISHRPRPAENERQVAALCMLVPGVGPERARAILKRMSFSDIALATEEDLRQVPGIGPRLAGRIVDALRYVAI